MNRHIIVKAVSVKSGSELGFWIPNTSDRDRRTILTLSYALRIYSKSIFMVAPFNAVLYVNPEDSSSHRVLEGDYLVLYD